MALLPPHLLPSPIQAPPADQVIEGPQWRIEILSDTVIRLEWDPSGEFLDTNDGMAQVPTCEGSAHRS